jgi:hypothetical protein
VPANMQGFDMILPTDKLAGAANPKR